MKKKAAAMFSTGVHMALFQFPCFRSKQNKQHAIQSIADYRKKKSEASELTVCPDDDCKNYDEALSLGERFTLTDDVHNPIIQCNNCKGKIIFTYRATVPGMREAMQNHKCKSQEADQ
jgi:hypothetical protein